MEFQPVTQSQLPQLAILLRHRAGDHLRLRIAVGIEGVQRVEHHQDVVARDERADQRIEQGEVRVRDEFQRARALRPHDGRGGNHGGSTLQERTALHVWGSPGPE